MEHRENAVQIAPERFFPFRRPESASIFSRCCAMFPSELVVACNKRIEDWYASVDKEIAKRLAELRVNDSR
jgi:hypothetical protein